MRPTFSIIFFTVMSGAGYGLWILMALASLLIWPEHPPGNGMAEVAWPNLLPCALAAGFLLVSCGLVSSLGHLGQPQRAWRALSQWRTSWLSREGIAAILTYLPVIGIGSAIFHDGRMPVDAMTGGDPLAALWMSSEMRTVASILLLAGSVATILCTANIYACLKPVRAWHNRHVVAGYLLIGIYSGALLAWALAALPQGQIVDLRVLPVLVAVFAFATALLKHRYWRFIDHDPASSTADATGLGSLGNVRSFEQPHTQENYLTHEMGFRLARKHSRKLRTICLIAGFALPALLALLGLAWPSLSAPAAWLALIGGMSGIFVERWLFFAEAKHTVMLYYGARNAD